MQLPFAEAPPVTTLPTAALTIGLEGRVTAIVTDAMSAPRVGSGTVPVLASPMMIALIEAAAVDCVEARLPDGFATLGTHLDIAHIAPSPVGIGVEAKAELIAVDGRKLTFRVEARDAREVIGRGTHTRVVVDRARFEARLAAKT